MKKLSFYRKWIKGECSHICLFCRHNRLCIESLAIENEINLLKEKQRYYSDTKMHSYILDDIETVDRFNNLRDKKWG